MAEEHKKPKSLEMATPKIPGVPARPAHKPANVAEAAEEENPRENRRASPAWALAGGAILVLVIAVLWWAHSAGTNKRGSAASLSAHPSSDSAQAAQSTAMPVAPGPIATVTEMKDVWSTKQFVYRETNGDKSPALLVRLPKDAYWAISLREPFGTCELEFASVQKLQSDYNLAAPYPMIGDPCTHAVFDLTQYSDGPNGVVRGAIVAGAAVRPPLAIEVTVKDGEIIASQEEEAVKVQ